MHDLVCWCHSPAAGTSTIMCKVDSACAHVWPSQSCTATRKLKDENCQVICFVIPGTLHEVEVSEYNYIILMLF